MKRVFTPPWLCAPLFLASPYFSAPSSTPSTSHHVKSSCLEETWEVGWVCNRREHVKRVLTSKSLLSLLMRQSLTCPRIGRCIPFMPRRVLGQGKRKKGACWFPLRKVLEKGEKKSKSFLDKKKIEFKKGSWKGHAEFLRRIQQQEFRGWFLWEKNQERNQERLLVKRERIQERFLEKKGIDFLEKEIKKEKARFLEKGFKKNCLGRVLDWFLCRSLLEGYAWIPHGCESRNLSISEQSRSS